ncbi:MAG: methyltransferase [Methylibium sp.]|uniref:methyltransferase n=1 Tax=Methylibium sp. TaxID=2067992 RepID=UPI0018151D19|nr:methyltransferase [Methylibium sp.]
MDFWRGALRCWWADGFYYARASARPPTGHQRESAGRHDEYRSRPRQSRLGGRCARAAWQRLAQQRTRLDVNWLYFHSAYPTNQDDAVFFGPDTYRFTAAIDVHLAGGRTVRRAVDICCGAGRGAVVIALARPDADVHAVDINDAALRLTAVNAAGWRHPREAAPLRPALDP